MGQPDLSTNSLISHPDVFADIINAFVYEGKQVLAKEHLKPFYTNAGAAKEEGALKGLYRDVCMEDLRGGVRYVIWGIENQYVDDYTTPFKVMGYDFTAYDRQIEEFTAQNKTNETNAYVNGLLPEQKLKPVITIVLYYGTKGIPDNICAMIDMLEDDAVRRYVQNYKLNMVNLRELTIAQAQRFQSDFGYIAKFLTKSYNKKEYIEDLKKHNPIVIHTKDTLHALAAITKDKRYLRLSETKKEGTAMCEVLDLIYNEGFEEGVTDGISQGILQERTEGIKSMIELCKEIGLQYEDTLKRVAQKYHLTDKEISDYMEQYWI